MNEKINKAGIHIVRIVLSPLFIGVMLLQEMYEAVIRLCKRTVLYFTIPLYTKTEVERQYEEFKKRYPKFYETADGGTPTIVTSMNWQDEDGKKQ